MENIRIRVGELVVGRALPWPVYNHKGILLLRRGHIIETHSQLSALLQHGLYRDPKDCGEAQKPQPAIADDCPFDVIEALAGCLQTALSRIERGETDALTRIDRFATEIQRLCRQDADAALGAVHLCHKHSYPIMHSIHTAILCELMGQRVGYEKTRRRLVVCAALTANLGMLSLQEQLSAQTDPLTNEQRVLIQAHPRRSVEMLRQAGLSDRLWLTITEQHHERIDGSGYDHGLKADTIVEESCVVALADIYSAMIAPRTYRRELLAKEALREIFLGRGKQVDERLATLFIKEIGVFPPGALVYLANGETAVIIRRGREGTAPVAVGIISPRGGPYLKPVRRCCEGEEHRIRDMIPCDTSVPLNLRALWGY